MLCDLTLIKTIPVEITFCLNTISPKSLSLVIIIKFSADRAERLFVGKVYLHIESFF
jgi:hypothetical protein